MTGEIGTSIASNDAAMVFAAVELSLATWLVGIATPSSRTVSRHQVKGGDIAD